MSAVPEPFATLLADRYLIERPLGRGGASIVYLARELRHDRLVALKVLDPELSRIVGTERFEAEVRLLARLRHPNILPLLDSGEAGGHLFYTTPFIEGDSLRAELQRTGPLPLNQAIRLGIEIADALAYAHAEGVIHRDIKPENILIEADHAVVADFGIALAIDRGAGERLTGTGLSIGTPAYMSPEQSLANERLDARSDIYSTGCVLYEMLTGEAPHTGSTAQAIIARRLSSAPAPLTALRAGVPVAVERIVMRALAPSPADRFQNAAELREALELALAAQMSSSGVPERAPARKRWSARAVTFVISAAVASAAIWFVARPRPASSSLDADLVAIAPFEVLDPALELWRQGLVDVLAANLDGAGPLRTVPPTVVMHGWTGRADRASAALVARRTGAGISVFGRLEAAGPDSVRCTVWILAAESGASLGEVELREEEARMDRLGDSLSVAIVRELGRGRTTGPLRFGSLGSRSLPAIKLYLQGEQFFRRLMLDSARAAFERAVATDSTFGLAINRLARVLTWQGTAASKDANQMLMRATRFVSGLAPRDSLQLTAGALFGRLQLFLPDTAWWSAGQELRRVLEELSARSPRDPEVWNQIGEMHFHLRGAVGGSWEEAQTAFDRAIGFDSTFAPAYIHPISILLARSDRDSARRYAALLRRSQGRPDEDSWPRLVEDLIGERSVAPAELERRLGSMTAEEVFEVWAAVNTWPDSAETGLVVARAMARARASGMTDLGDPIRARRLQRLTLLDRGHFREAIRLDAEEMHGDLPYLAALGVVPGDSAGRVFDGWVRERSPHAHFALPWWAAQGDVEAIRRLQSAARSRSSSPAADERNLARFETAASEAYLALIRSDTSRAITLLLALPDSLCPLCFTPRLTLGQLLSARHLDADADSLLRRDLTALPFRVGVPEMLWKLERARLAERRGDNARAAVLYQSIALLYRFGDREARRIAEEAGRNGVAVSRKP